MSTAFDEFLQEVELERLESEQKGMQKGRYKHVEETVLMLLEEGWPLAKISAKMKEPIELLQTLQQKFIQQGLLPA